MQTTEQDRTVQGAPAPTEPISENLHLTEQESDEIFRLAEAEIQPLLKKAAIERWTGRLQAAFCLCMIVTGLIGTVYGVVNYPKTTVTIFPVQKNESMTTDLNIPLRTLAPVTVTREASSPTTGKGHQDAVSASGILTFYNGSLSSQVIAVGSVFTGQDGTKIATNQTVTIPAANPPQEGKANVTASAINAGRRGNIATDAIHVAFSSDLLVRNLASFTGGRNARDFPAVAPQDLQNLTSTVNETVTQAFTTAFSLPPGEAALPTTCHTTTTPNHQIGEEAQSVTLIVSRTCSAIAYNRQQLKSRATAAFSHTKPAAPYHLVGSVQTTLQNVTPLSVAISGKWAYTFSPDYEQLLAQKIQGDTPEKARTYLLKTGVIAYASVPSTLPVAMYINFLVLVG